MQHFTAVTVCQGTQANLIRPNLYTSSEVASLSLSFSFTVCATEYQRTELILLSLLHSLRNGIMLIVKTLYYGVGQKTQSFNKLRFTFLIVSGLFSVTFFDIGLLVFIPFTLCHNTVEQFKKDSCLYVNPSQSCHGDHEYAVFKSQQRSLGIPDHNDVSLSIPQVICSSHHTTK